MDGARVEIITEPAEMQARADALRAAGRRLVLVPTMGGLHAGHDALVRAARREGDHVTVSVFVNPTQFGPGEDYDAYPRDLGRDAARLESTGGADLVFAPGVAGMYPDGQEAQMTWVDAPELQRHLCAPGRPGHFRGVATVVAKLFLYCRPHVGVFGLKDAQQYFILRRMVRDLGFGIDMVGVETVREADGLALSSRNAYLSEAERRQAPALYAAVTAARVLIEGGEQRSESVVIAMTDCLRQAPLVRAEYAEVVDTRRLLPMQRIEPGQTVLAAVAARLGRARLIDNVLVVSPPRH